jgi:hypothetical protein
VSTEIHAEPLGRFEIHLIKSKSEAVFPCRALVRHELAMEQQWDGTAKHGSANLSRAGR